MKRPDHVIIMGRRYSVLYVPEPKAEGGESSIGYVDPLKQEIRIWDGCCVQRELDVLLHEIIHVLSDDLCLGMEENAVHALGVALADTLIRNGMMTMEGG
jgi:hypothetical protein